MDEGDWLAERFEANRPHLRAVAYRMLGSLSEADDPVQEAWLRLNRSDTSGVANLGGWLTTLVARVCLDMLRAAVTSTRWWRCSTRTSCCEPTSVPCLRAHPEWSAARRRWPRALAFARRARFARPALVNGAAGTVVAAGCRPVAVMGFTVGPFGPAGRSVRG